MNPYLDSMIKQKESFGNIKLDMPEYSISFNEPTEDRKEIITLILEKKKNSKLDSYFIICLIAPM